MLKEMGYPQPATPVITDNSMVAGIANATVKQRRSKAMDMRYFWVSDCTHQNQFQIVWRKGKYNQADYISKHHPASYHQAIRSAYVSGKKDRANKNYFQILQEEEDEEETNDIPPDRGEGVLKSGPCTSCVSGQSRHDPLSHRSTIVAGTPRISKPSSPLSRSIGSIQCTFLFQCGVHPFELCRIRPAVTVKCREELF
jgi:hypothetical protein